MVIKQVEPGDIEIGNLKCLFFGQSGSGKTYLALSFPSPIVLNLERGTGLLSGFTSIEGISSLDDCDEIINLLRKDEGNTYKTVIVDSLDELMNLIIQTEVLSYSTKRPYDDQLTQSDYGKLGRSTMLFCRNLLSLSEYYNIVFIISETSVSYEGEQRQPGSPGKIVRQELPRLVDLFGCVFTDKEGAHKLNLYNSNTSVGKNRFNLPTKSIPNTYESIMSFIEYQYNKDK